MSVDLIKVVMGTGFYTDTGVRYEANDRLGHAEASKDINLLKAYFKRGSRTANIVSVSFRRRRVWQTIVSLLPSHAADCRLSTAAAECF